MNRIVGRLALSVLSATLFAQPSARAQTSGPPVDIEVGYRFVDVSGNEDMYRSQINEREGFLLHALLLTAPHPTAFFDDFRIDASDLGAGPAGSFRVRASLAGKYDLQVSFRRTEMFSALPGFANPLLDQGIVPGQHTYDRVRNVFDAELSVLPGGAVTPILGYTRNRYEGPGRTTYHVGQDEFQLTDRLDDDDQEFHVGAAFEGGPISGQIIQGWRKLHEVETQALVSGAGNGNDPGTVLGIPVSLSDFNRTTKTDTNTPVTNAFLAARLGNRVRLIGSWVHAAAEEDTGSREDLTGDLVSFEIGRFFGGLSEALSSRAKREWWKGGGRIEAQIADGVDLVAGYSRNHSELDGFALVSSLYFDTMTFAGQDPRNLLAVLQANTSLERSDEVYDVRLEARRVGPFALRAGWSLTNQDVTVSEDPSEIVIPGGQGGTFHREIRSFEAGATFSQGGLTLGGDYRRERADAAVVRTDFLDRDRFRLRAAWVLKQLLRLSATAEQIDASNDDTGIGYDGRIRQYGGDAEVTPGKVVTFRLSGRRYQTDSKILIREPQDFSVDRSIHRENGRVLEGGVSLLFSPVVFDGSLSRYENEGSFPFTLDRAGVRAEVGISRSASLVGEWSRDRYHESAAVEAGLGSFDANRFGVFLRWRQ